MQQELQANRITLLTLIAAVTGALAVVQHPVFALLIVPVLLLPRFLPIIASQSWEKVAQFTGTTFIFGVIDGFCLLDIFSFVGGNCEGSVPLLQIYLLLLTIYHYFQFQLINNFHHSTLDWKCFLLYHSNPYLMATAFMFLEHIVTKYLFQFQYKERHCLIPLGLLLTTAGEGLRIAAFYTCRSNFTHLVRFRKVEGHELVTNGVYSIFRHPSYTGYFYFSIGGQILLGNVLSLFAFAFVLTRFFNDRIDYEEKALAKFFPEYLEYRRHTYILIPLVKNPNLDARTPDYDYADSD